MNTFLNHMNPLPAPFPQNHPDQFDQSHEPPTRPIHYPQKTHFAFRDIASQELSESSSQQTHHNSLRTHMSNTTTHCPICLNLITTAIQLPCSHVLCNECITTLKKLQKKDDIVLERHEVDDALDFTTSCPMCRYEFPLSQARHNPEYDEQIKAEVGEEAYNAELQELQEEQLQKQNQRVLVVGNIYKHVDTGTMNSNKWTFFVKMLDANVQEYVKKVEIVLHPTFTPSRITLTKAPFKIVRLGWGVFVIRCTVYFHDKWGMAPKRFDHMLSFEGCGSFSEFPLEFKTKEERDKQHHGEQQGTGGIAQ